MTAKKVTAKVLANFDIDSKSFYNFYILTLKIKLEAFELRLNIHVLMHGIEAILYINVSKSRKSIPSYIMVFN